MLLIFLLMFFNIFKISSEKYIFNENKFTANSTVIHQQ